MTDTFTQSTRRQWLARRQPPDSPDPPSPGGRRSPARRRSRRRPRRCRSPEFEPKSMLHVAMTTVQGARFPVIDFHTHVSRRRAAIDRRCRRPNC